MRSRNNALQTIRQETFDVCIIGGGATGLGCALDARLRGLSTVLLDAGDFVSRTSTASTKLVHGGVRYLQQAVADFDYGQYTMVRKALHERIHMLRCAPFLAHPLELLVPCFSWWEVVYFTIGMKAYDWIAGAASLFPSRALSKAESLQKMPSLRSEKLVGTVPTLMGSSMMPATDSPLRRLLRSRVGNSSTMPRPRASAGMHKESCPRWKSRTG
jgi:glycerol-3-phosphate dehydrogenase